MILRSPRVPAGLLSTTSLGKCLVKSYAHLLIGIFGFLLLDCMSSLYILDITPYQKTYNISSLTGCFFFFLVYFILILSLQNKLLNKVAESLFFTLASLIFKVCF